MKTIAVIYCPKDNGHLVFKNKIFNSIPSYLKKIILHRIVPIWKYLEIPELKVKVCMIQFPCDRDTLGLLAESKISKYCSRIELLLKKLEFENVVLDDGIEKHKSIVDYFNSLEGICLFNGKKIFTLYLEEIIRSICKLLSVSINDLRIGIIADRLDVEKECLIKRLVTELRFLSIVSPNYKNMVKLTEKIYEDTGLVITVSDDDKNVFKECNIVINFSNDSEFVNNCKLYEHTIVVNYGVKIQKKNYKGVIISGLNMYSNKFSLKTYTWLGQLNFCEALVSQNDIITSNIDNKRDFEINYINELKKIGYRISGFVGCNGNIAKEEFDYLAQNYKKKRTI